MFHRIGNIQLYIESNYDAMSARAADIFAEQAAERLNGVYGFATGSTPIGMYKALIKKYHEKKLDFSQWTTFNLDEYYPIKRDNDQSYRFFMEQQLFNHVNLNKSNINLLDGEAEDATVECRAYEEKISLAGGITLQLLGIGTNGHIGFNEPDDYFSGTTGIVNLTQNTINDNARFFESSEQVPRQALSMGIRTIMSAQKILLIASGSNKSPIIAQMLYGRITPQVPASVLQLHRHVTVVLDDAAAVDTRQRL